MDLEWIDRQIMPGRIEIGEAFLRACIGGTESFCSKMIVDPNLILGFIGAGDLHYTIDSSGKVMDAQRASASDKLEDQIHS